MYGICGRPAHGGGPGTAAGKDVQDSGDGGAPRQYYVFVIPIDSELSLKKAARAVGVKSLSMIPVKDITAVTGYVRGGCTALGMKKKYPTVIDSGAEALPEIVVSGGRLGCQIELAPADLLQAADASFADVAEPGGLP